MRTRFFAGVARAMRIARFAEARRLRTPAALDRVAELEHAAARRRIGRRELLGGLAAAAVAGVAGAAATLARPGPALSKPGRQPRIAVVGAGLAGLVCADRLRRAGVAATLYEANRRLGGRVSSTRAFPGQVGEKGGELLDNLHKTLLGYVVELGLTREDLDRAPGETVYHFGGQRYAEAEVVDEYRALVARMRPDLQVLGAPTFSEHTEAEAALDRTDLASYLDDRARGLPLIRAVLDVAYTIEYGLELHEQSCLNLLLFIHLDRRSKFAPFGIFSDERFHVVEGNDRISAGIAARLPGPILTGASLVRLGRSALGEYQLWFADASRPERADAVVLTLPFSVLREVELEASLGLTADKRRAIAQLTYGANAKTMIGFTGRPWWTLHGGNGDMYADLPNLQNTWETSWTTAGATAVLTDYAGGDRGRALQVGAPGRPLGCPACHGGGPRFFDIDEQVLQQQTDAFLTDLDRTLPGTKAAATRVDGRYLVERGHWLPQPYSRGSYTCNAPGYFTTIAGLEGQSAGLLKFAGEHANSFYEWQGYMEGACLSGLAAAEELLEDIQHGRL